jgi:hypothetical protein
LKNKEKRHGPHQLCCPCSPTRLFAATAAASSCRFRCFVLLLSAAAATLAPLLALAPTRTDAGWWFEEEEGRRRHDGVHDSRQRLQAPGNHASRYPRQLSCCRAWLLFFCPCPCPRPCLPCCCLPWQPASSAAAAVAVGRLLSPRPRACSPDSMLLALLAPITGRCGSRSPRPTA